MIIFLVCNFISSYTALFRSLVPVFYQVKLSTKISREYAKQIVWPVNLTWPAYFINVNPALTSHINCIKIYFLKTLGLLVEQMHLHVYVADAIKSVCQRYFVGSYTAVRGP